MTISSKKKNNIILINELFHEMELYLDNGNRDLAEKRFKSFFQIHEPVLKVNVLYYRYTQFPLPECVRNIFLELITPEFLYDLIIYEPSMIEFENSHDEDGQGIAMSCKLCRLLSRGYQENISSVIDKFLNSNYGRRSINYIKLKYPNIYIAPWLTDTQEL